MRHGAVTSTTAVVRPTQPVQDAAAIFTAAFLIAGIAGFVPGLTSNVDNLQFYGRPENTAAPAELFGLFHVSVLHNLVHLAFGLVGLLLHRSARASLAFLIGGGMTYAVVASYGMAVDQHGAANVLPVNEADNWLHAGLALAMIALGGLLPRRVDTEGPAGSPADELHLG